MMKKIPAALSLALAFAALGLPARAQVPMPAQEDAVASAAGAVAQFTEEDLDQMLAPVALYPDELLAEVLMAATYPLEVVEADRWVKAHRGLQGDQAVEAVDDQDWDPSVKALVAFPDLLATMSAQLSWTERLGEAFIGQGDDTMRAVQKLRRAAYDQGNLASNDQMVLSRDGDALALDSPSPDTMYVPYYDPRQVYGDWWWDAPPVYWSPWQDYYVFTGYGFAWGAGVAIGSNFFIGDFDWRRRHVIRNPTHPFYDHGRDHRPTPNSTSWHHDPTHRHNVPWRNPVARQEATRPHGTGTGAGSRAGNPVQRGQGSDAARSPRQPAPQQGTPWRGVPAQPPVARDQPQQGTPWRGGNARPEAPQGGTQPIARPNVVPRIERAPAPAPAPVARPAPAEPVERPAANPLERAPQPVARPAPAPAERDNGRSNDHSDDNRGADNRGGGGFQRR